MVGQGNRHGVDAGVVKRAAEIGHGLSVWSALLLLAQSLCVDVADVSDLSVVQRG